MLSEQSKKYITEVRQIMLEIKNITKKFGDNTALENLSFTIPEGSVFGLIGSNGSGKSTLLRIISGVIYPDGGTAGGRYRGIPEVYGDRRLHRGDRP